MDIKKLTYIEAITNKEQQDREIKKLKLLECHSVEYTTREGRLIVVEEHTDKSVLVDMTKETVQEILIWLGY